MIRGTDFWFVISIIFCLVYPYHSLHVKYPANVTISRARSSLNHTYAVKIKGPCRTWNLQLVPLKNIWYIANESESVNNNLMNIIKNIKVYHDPEIGSVLSVNGNEVEGILDSDFSIINEKKEQFIVKLYQNDTEGINDVIMPNNDSINYYKNLSIDIGTLDVDNVTNTFGDNPQMSYYGNVKWPNPMFVIDVFVDSDIADILGDNAQILKYLSIFWNRVLLALKLADTSIAMDLTLNLAKFENDSYKIDLPFITNNAENPDADIILNDLSQWAASRYGRSYYEDIVYVHTNKDLSNNGDNRALGAALTIGGICNSIAISGAIGEDIDAIYNGVRTAAHEIAHVLGATHDGDQNSCEPNSNLLMASVRTPDMKIAFSNCSIQSIKSTLVKNWNKCRERKDKIINEKYGPFGTESSASTEY